MKENEHKRKRTWKKTNTLLRTIYQWKWWTLWLVTVVIFKILYWLEAKHSGKTRKFHAECKSNVHLLENLLKDFALLSIQLLWQSKNYSVWVQNMYFWSYFVRIFLGRTFTESLGKIKQDLLEVINLILYNLDTTKIIRIQKQVSCTSGNTRGRYHKKNRGKTQLMSQF